MYPGIVGLMTTLPPHPQVFFFFFPPHREYSNFLLLYKIKGSKRDSVQLTTGRILCRGGCCRIWVGR
jgi:hypothetical protein